MYEIYLNMSKPQIHEAKRICIVCTCEAYPNHRRRLYTSGESSILELISSLQLCHLDR